MFRSNNIGTLARKPCRKRLKNKNTSLQRLNHNRNKIGDTGAKPVASACEQHEPPAPEPRDNNIGPTGGSPVAALENNTSPSPHLNLSRNNIGDTGGSPAQALKTTRASSTWTSVTIISETLARKPCRKRRTTRASAPEPLEQ